MKSNPIWMAMVTDEQEVVFGRACASPSRAEKAIVTYLLENRAFTGQTFADACRWIGENSLRLGLMVFPLGPEDFIEVQMLPVIALPSLIQEPCRITYVIDVGTGDTVEAAKQAYRMMRESPFLPPVLEITDNQGNRIKIDLSPRQQETQK